MNKEEGTLGQVPRKKRKAETPTKEATNTKQQKKDEQLKDSTAVEGLTTPTASKKTDGNQGTTSRGSEGKNLELSNNNKGNPDANPKSNTPEKRKASNNYILASAKRKHAPPLPGGGEKNKNLKSPPGSSTGVSTASTTSPPPQKRTRNESPSRVNDLELCVQNFKDKLYAEKDYLGKDLSGIFMVDAEFI